MGRAPVLSLLTLVLLAAPAAAETYRWVDGKGVVNYSDQPPQQGPVAGEREALIEEALTLSGVRKQIEVLPTQVRAGAEAAQSSMPPRERALVAKIIGEAFRSAPILASVRTAFQQRYDPMQMGLLLVQLRTPLARKMTELEGEAFAPDFIQKLRAFVAQLKDAPPAQGRMARLAQLDAISGTTDLMLELRVAAIAAAVKALSPLMPPERRIASARVDAAARDLVGRQRDTTGQETLLTFLYVYRDATEQELDEYIGIGGSESGRWFQDVYRKALLQALTASTERAVRGVAGSFPPKPR
jgi:hypothetical protein